ncbi:MAG: exodeoxyribonuclease VII small subunit [Bacteroidales bacterium]|nr:exodeoxyribonuclease VII small subunit [Bacteroidales bacterium]
MSTITNYSDAISELEQIVSQIEQSKVPLDELIGKIKRASELIGACREKLYNTSSEINKIIEDIDHKDDSDRDAINP